MATGDLTTLANVKAFISPALTTTESDTLLTRLITAESARLRKMIGWYLLTADYTETRNGDGSPQITLPVPKVTAVASVTVDGDTIPARATVLDSGWVLDGDTVKLYGYWFNRGVENVVIVYTAGYAAAPGEVEQAVIDAVIARHKGRDHAGIKSRTSDTGGSVQFSDADPLEAVAAQHQRYGF